MNAALATVDKRRAAQRWVLAPLALLDARAARLDWLSGAGRLAGAGGSAAMLRGRFEVQSGPEARRAIARHFSRARAAREPVTRVFLLVRASAMAAWACGCFLLELDEAWREMARAAEELQACAGSWRELGESYLRGHALRGRDPLELEELVTRLERALAPRGLWRSLPWGLPLGDVSAPRMRTRLTLIQGGRW